MSADGERGAGLRALCELVPGIPCSHVRYVVGGAVAGEADPTPAIPTDELFEATRIPVADDRTGNPHLRRRAGIFDWGRLKGSCYCHIARSVASSDCVPASLLARADGRRISGRLRGGGEALGAREETNKENGKRRKDSVLDGDHGDA